MKLSASQLLIKKYSDKEYKYTTSVVHRGNTIAFSMDGERRIHYAVLAMNGKAAKIDSMNWPDDPKMLIFPNEVEQVGYSIIGSTPLPLVKKGGVIEATAKDYLRPDEIDPFLSTTARLSADAPFQVFSDGSHVFVFRQSLETDHKDMVYKLNSGGVSGDSRRPEADFVLDGSSKVPLVDSTLLCDRFILASSELRPTLETRYQRSRHRTKAASASDTLGVKDMEGRPFFEPTQELAFVKNLQGGRFSVLQLPTQISSVKRWQLFSHNVKNDCMDSYNLEVRGDGLFNPAGSTLYTSPSPDHSKSVLEREPGTCPFTGMALVPLQEKGGHAETCVRFGGSSHATKEIDLWSTDQFTVEMWAKADTAQMAAYTGVFSSSNNPSLNGSFQIDTDGNGNFRLNHSKIGGKTFGKISTVWQHIAIASDGSHVTILLDGVATAKLPCVPSGFNAFVVGANRARNLGFKGLVDEVRVWEYGRDPQDILKFMNRRLVGNESGLRTYYRFDEGSGTTLTDQSGNGNNCTLAGDDFSWAASDAAIGDSPSLRCSSVALVAENHLTEEQLRAALESAKTVDAAPSQEPETVTELGPLSDVARGKPTTQSSTGYGGISARAVDGDRNGHWSSSGVTHTAESDSNPWWRVDFGNVYSIETVLVFGRTDGFQSRLNVCVLELLDDNMTVVAKREFRGTFGSSAQLNFDGAEGSRLRVSNPGCGPLSLTSVEVSGREPPVIVTVAQEEQEAQVTNIVIDHSGRRSLIGGMSSCLYYQQEEMNCGYDGAEKLMKQNARVMCSFPSVVKGRPGSEALVAMDFAISRDGKIVQVPDSLTLPVLAKPQGQADIQAVSKLQNEISAMKNAIHVLLNDINTAKSTHNVDGQKALDRIAWLKPEIERLSNPRYIGFGWHCYIEQPTAQDLADAEKYRGELAELEKKVAEVYSKPPAELEEKERLYHSTKADLENKEVEISLLSNGEFSELKLKMKMIHFDQSGMTLNAALLPFAKSEHSPFLFESANGKLSVYFRSTDGKFMAAYVDTKVSRAQFDLPSLAFLARSAGTHLDDGVIAISPGSDADTCTLTITNPTLNVKEEWANLPRDPDELAAIVNGQKERPESVYAKIEPEIYSLTKGSSQIVVAPKGENTVQDGAAVMAKRGSDCAWIAEAPGRAYYFGGSQLIAAKNDIDRFDAGDKCTIETWVKPLKAGTGHARLIHFNLDESAYFMGLEKKPSQTSFCFDGSSRLIYPQPKALEYFGRGFSVEAFVLFDSMEQGKTVFHLSKDASNAMQLLLDHANRLQLVVQCDGDKVYSKRMESSLSPYVWYHVACVWNPEEDTCRLYVEGQEQLLMPSASKILGHDAPALVLGGQVSLPATQMKGKVDEVRVWNYAKRKDDVTSEMSRCAYINESGLVGYFTFEDGEALDHSRFGNHGSILCGKPTVGNQCDSLEKLCLVAGTSAGQSSNHDGQLMLRSTVAMDSGKWNHVACSGLQSYALDFNGGDNLVDCGHSSELDICDDLTVEVFLKIPELNRAHGLLSKGRLGQKGQSSPYQLGIDRSGRVRFVFEDSSGKCYNYLSNMSVIAGSFHRLAVTRKRGMTTKEQKGTKSFEFTNADGDKEVREVEMIESVNTEEWSEITFYIDGKIAGTSRYHGQAPSGNDGNFVIGRSEMGGRTSYFKGAISEVRVWGKARATEEIGKTIEEKEMGLAAWFQFEEREGNIAVDGKSSNHGHIQGAKRIKSPDPEGGEFSLYINGVRVQAERVEKDEHWQQVGFSDKQFSIGGVMMNGTVGDGLGGTLEELRIWRTYRTPEQLMDNMFNRLKGEKEDIVAYFPFDDDSTQPESTTLMDHGFNHLDIELPTGDQRPSSVLSTAPISDDAAIVRSALIGVGTAFQIAVDNTPAVLEYSDLQMDKEGNQFGVIKRCYSYISEGQWLLYTGYKVGSLQVEWIGQAQFDPQVIGFIEGCPPLPSENLTDGCMSADYENYAFVATLSNMEMIESDTVTYNVSSSQEAGANYSFEASLATDFGDDTLLITAPLGIGIAKKALEVDFSAGVNANVGGELGWDSEQSFGTSINKSRSLSVGLGGTWEPMDESQQLNPAVGRRLLPGNMGFALVQSETADIFAMRMSHTGALVSFQMRPNPDIPKDWNLIPFPINNKYVKQGSLDGRVGYDDKGHVVMDPDYSDAKPYGEYSYFKPKEAYALKKRIQREEQQLRSYYEGVSTNYASAAAKAVGYAVGAATSVIKGAAGGDVGGAIDNIGALDTGMAGKSLPQQYSKRNMVNTYVWTADGGFFAETTETTDMRSESSSGSFEFSGSVGGTMGIDFSVFSLGFSLEMNMSLGGNICHTKTKDKESEKSFSIELSVDPPGDLQIYKRKESGIGMDRIYDEDGNGVNAAGKVDAYRFMTFYLDSDKRNFEDLFQKVVDPVWLAESDHPNAIAMRQANQSAKKPACWRILHRVTFISRLLPDFSDPLTPPSLEKQMKEIDIASNFQLVKKFEPLVRNKTGDERLFKKAVKSSIEKYMPELKPHTDEITLFLKQYFGML